MSALRPIVVIRYGPVFKKSENLSFIALFAVFHIFKHQALAFSARRAHGQADGPGRRPQAYPLVGRAQMKAIAPGEQPQEIERVAIAVIRHAGLTDCRTHVGNHCRRQTCASLQELQVRPGKPFLVLETIHGS